MDPITPLENPGDYGGRLSGLGVALHPLVANTFGQLSGLVNARNADSCVLVIFPDAFNLVQGFKSFTIFERKEVDGSG